VSYWTANTLPLFPLSDSFFSPVFLLSYNANPIISYFIEWPEEAFVHAETVQTFLAQFFCGVDKSFIAQQLEQSIFHNKT
jgi:hypothetical protein